MQILHRVDGTGVEPACACGGCDDEDGAIEAADTFEFLERQLRLLLLGFGRPHADIHADGRLTLTAQKIRQIGLRGTVNQKVLAATSDRIPGDGGVGTPAHQRVDRLFNPFVNQLIGVQKELVGGIK